MHIGAPEDHGSSGRRNSSSKTATPAAGAIAPCVRACACVHRTVRTEDDRGPSASMGATAPCAPGGVQRGPRGRTTQRMATRGASRRSTPTHFRRSRAGGFGCGIKLYTLSAITVTSALCGACAGAGDGRRALGACQRPLPRREGGRGRRRARAGMPPPHAPQGHREARACGAGGGAPWSAREAHRTGSPAGRRRICPLSSNSSFSSFCFPLDPTGVSGLLLGTLACVHLVLGPSLAPLSDGGETSKSAGGHDGRNSITCTGTVVLYSRWTEDVRKMAVLALLQRRRART